MNNKTLMLYEQCVPFLLPVKGGPCSISLGLLSFTLDGLCSIGPHSFHYTQPIEFEYEGHRLFRAPKSNTLEVTTPFGEVYRYRYFSHSHTWMEVRTFEKSPSSWSEIKRLFCDTLQQEGPILGTMALVIGIAAWFYLAVLFAPLYLLWRGLLYVVVLIFALCISRGLYAAHWGALSINKSDEAILAAYFFPVGFAAIAITQVVIAAWKYRGLWSWRTWRNIGVRLACLSMATCALFYFYVQDVPVHPKTFSAAWERVFDRSDTDDKRATPQSPAKIPWGIERAIDRLDPSIRPPGVSQPVEYRVRITN